MRARDAAVVVLHAALRPANSKAKVGNWARSLRFLAPRARPEAVADPEGVAAPAPVEEAEGQWGDAVAQPAQPAPAHFPVAKGPSVIDESLPRPNKRNNKRE